MMKHGKENLQILVLRQHSPASVSLAALDKSEEMEQQGGGRLVQKRQHPAEPTAEHQLGRLNGRIGVAAIIRMMNIHSIHAASYR